MAFRQSCPLELTLNRIDPMMLDLHSKQSDRRSNAPTTLSEHLLQDYGTKQPTP